MDVIAIRGFDGLGRDCAWLKAECSDMPLHVRIVKAMMDRSDISLLSLGAIGGSLACNLSVGKYTMTVESSRSFNEQIMGLCVSMLDHVPDEFRVCPRWSCVVCVLRNESTRASGVSLSMIPTDEFDFRWVLIFDDFELHTFHGSCSCLEWHHSTGSSSSSAPPVWQF